MGVGPQMLQLVGTGVVCSAQCSSTQHPPLPGPRLYTGDIFHQPLVAYGDPRRLSAPASWFTLFPGSGSEKAFQVSCS